jgi:hypothetical protein
MICGDVPPSQRSVDVDVRANKPLGRRAAAETMRRRAMEDTLEA